MQILLFSFLLGLGVAIPVGPVTIEMMRRNLRYGWSRGVVLGMGAVTADVVYLLLVLFGLLSFLQQATLLLHVLAVLGAALLLWFAYKTICQSTQVKAVNDNDKGVFHCYLSGFLIAFLSPFNIIFWLSIAAQFAALMSKMGSYYGLACIGLLLGTALWFCGLNAVVHFTRHYLSATVIRWMNMVGGVILVIFAAYTVWHVFVQS
jgi:L-lysine exporter family protein LysE/ArgO